VTPGSATAFDDIAQIATSSNRTSITLSSTQASSTFGDQMTYFSGAGMNATATAKKFASSVSSLDSSTFTSATSVTSFTAITNGDFIVIRVVAEDATTTKYYGYSVTVSSSGGGGGGGGGSICSSALLSNTSTIKGVTFTSGTRQASSTDFNGSGSSNMGSVSLTAAQASGNGATSIVATGGATATWLYVGPSINSWGNGDISTTADLVGITVTNGRLFEIKISGSGCTDYYRISIRVSSGSTPAPSTPTLTAAEIAAAAAAVAKAAAEAAAAARAAEVAVAQTKLSTVLKADKAGTIDEYKSANVNITTAASLARINAEVLKLSANDRSDFAKIKAIADAVEFDESFFNATARPTLSTYAKYEVVGITERTLPTINTKVLELPAALRVDAKAIQDLVKVESFVDQVANTQTRSTVTSAALISRGLLSADSPYKHSVRSGLGSYPEGSLNTMAKIEAAIKAELVKAGARKAQTAEIRARITARNK
jgi:hypothetical protein